MKTKLFLTGLAIIAMSAFANAQEPAAGQGQGTGRCRGTGTCRGPGFVDANKDGICDNQGKSTANMAGNRGNGTCNGKGQGQGRGNGKNFVDANKNGICDRFEAPSNK